MHIYKKYNLHITVHEVFLNPIEKIIKQFLHMDYSGLHHPF